MNEGHLHQWDDAYTLYHRPATRFVADFIGHGVFAPPRWCSAATTWWPKPLGRPDRPDEPAPAQQLPRWGM